MKSLIVIGLIFLFIGCAEDLNSELIMKKVESSKPNELKLVIKGNNIDRHFLRNQNLHKINILALKVTQTA